MLAICSVEHPEETLLFFVEEEQVASSYVGGGGPASDVMNFLLADDIELTNEKGISKINKLLTLINDRNRCPWLHLTERTRKAVSMILTARQILISESPVDWELCIFTDQWDIQSIYLVTIISYENNNERQSFYLHRIYYSFFKYIHFLINIPRASPLPAVTHVNDALLYCYQFIKQHLSVIKQESSR